MRFSNSVRYKSKRPLFSFESSPDQVTKNMSKIVLFWTALAFLGVSLVNGNVDFHREFVDDPFHQEFETPPRFGDEGIRANGLISFLKNLISERKREADLVSWKLELS